MNEYDTAMRKPITACEMDVVYGVFSVMMKNNEKPEHLVSVALKVENGISYLLSYAQQRKLYNPEDPLERAVFEIVSRAGPSAGSAAGTVTDLLGIEYLSKIIHAPHIKNTEMMVGQFFTQTPKTMLAPLKAQVEQYMGFLQHKKGVLKSLKKPAEGANEFILSEAVFPAIMSLHSRNATSAQGDVMSKKLGIDKKHAFLIKLRAFAKAQDWGSFMETIKKEKIKMSPEYFADMCIEHGKKDLAINFIKMMGNDEEKVNYLIDIE